MKFSIFDTKIVFGSTFPALMEGVESVKKDGWEPFGTPYTTNLPGNYGYGMMQMVVKNRSSE